MWVCGTGSGERRSQAERVPESRDCRAGDQGEMAGCAGARLAWCVHQRRARRLPALGGSRNAVGGEGRQACGGSGSCLLRCHPLVISGKGSVLCPHPDALLSQSSNTGKEIHSSFRCSMQTKSCFQTLKNRTDWILIYKEIKTSY